MKPEIISLPSVLYATGATKIIIDIINNALKQKTAVHLALAGGNSPFPIYSILADSNIDWEKIHIWVSDERYVAIDHPQSNFGQIMKYLTSKINLPSNHLHPLNTQLLLDQCAKSYQDQIIARNNAIFDLILLGMGDDGHTASLFPGHHDELASQKLVIPVTNSPKPPSQRISFTPKLINQSSQTILLSNNPVKSQMISDILRLPGKQDDSPIGILIKNNNNLKIITCPH